MKQRLAPAALLCLCTLQWWVPLPAQLRLATPQWNLGDVLAPFGLRESAANCNIIPTAEKMFPSTQGEVSSPIAAPGQPVEIRLSGCDSSAGFDIVPGNNVVNLTFQPPAGAMTVVSVPMQVQLCANGTTNAGQPCTQDNDCCIGCQGGCQNGVDECAAAGPCNVLRFALPNATALDTALPPSGDGLTPAGPATIAVTNGSGTVALIDQLFQPVRSCDREAEGVFKHFTVLPIPNDFQAVATGAVTQLLLTVDGDNSLLLPFKYLNVLPFGSGAPIARLLDGSTTFPAYAANPGTGISAALAAQPNRSSYVHSFTLDGRPLPPLLEVNTAGGIYGTADGAAGIIRLARNTPHCSTTQTMSCSVDDDCPTGESCLTPSDLFDVSDRLSQSGKGPIVISPAYSVSVRDAVPLRGLRSSQQAVSFTGSDGKVRLLDVSTGATTATNQSVTQLKAAGFSGPTAETAGNLQAYLQSESRDDADLNGDGDTRDSILRVFTANGAEKTAAQTIVAEPALAVNGRSLAISGPLVFFRSAEADMAHAQTTRASVRFDNSEATFASFIHDNEGGVGFQGMNAPVLSADGRYLTFSSRDPSIVTPATTNSTYNIYVRDLVFGASALVSRNSSGTEANDASWGESISANGRYVVFATWGTNFTAAPTPVCGAEPCSQVILYDRDLDENGIFDEPGGISADVISVSNQDANSLGNNNSEQAAVSSDGRFVVFRSDASNLVSGDTNGAGDIFVRDRCVGDSAPGDCTRSTRLVSFSACARVCVGGTRAGRCCLTSASCAGGGTCSKQTCTPPNCPANGPSHYPAVSADGRFVTFASDAKNLSIEGYRQERQVYLRPLGDANSTATELISVGYRGYSDLCLGGANDAGTCSSAADCPGGTCEPAPQNGNATDPSISADGRFVAFDTSADNVVPGDSPGDKVFVRDRLTGTTERITAGLNGAPADNQVGFAHLSGDGRFVAFWGRATNLVPNDTNGADDVFIHDRFTGITERVSVSSSGTQSDSDSLKPNRWISVSGDGRLVAFQSYATNLVPGDTNTTSDVFVHRIDATDLSADLNGDGDVADTVLQVFDTNTMSLRPAARVPANVAAVSNQRAVVLTHEADQGLSTSLNSDNDYTDTVAQLYDGFTGTLTSLNRAATHVAISANLVAMAVSEAQEGISPVPLNGDGDTDDDVLAVQALPLSGPPAPINLGMAAADLGAADICSGGNEDGQPCVANSGCTGGGSCRGVVVFVTPESAEGSTGIGCSATAAGGCDLNGDKDASDRVLRLYSQATGQTTSVAAAQDFVVAGHLIAFRTSEAAQGDTDLNLDGDKNDFVMQIYDLSTRTLINSGQAAMPCTLPACTFFPYKVDGDNVSFLTNEVDQNLDLNGNGSKSDIVMQVFNTRTRKSQVFDISAEAPTVDPFPAVFIGRSVACYEAKESSVGRDINLDGVVNDAAVVLCTGDTDGDGHFDLGEPGDDCPARPNPDQSDANLNGLGDETCDAAGLCDAMIPSSPPSVPTSAVECQQDLGKVLAKYIKTSQKAVQSCLNKLAAGKVSGDAATLCGGQVVNAVSVAPPQDPKTAKKIASAARKVKAPKSCSDAIVGTLTACAKSANTVPDCLRAAAAAAALGSTQIAYGDGFGAIGDKAVRACQTAVGNATAKYLNTVVTAMRACLDTLNENQLAGDRQVLCLGSLSTAGVVAPADAETASTITGAETKLRATIAAKCPGITLAGLNTCAATATSAGDCLTCANWRHAVEAVRSAYGPN